MGNIQSETWFIVLSVVAGFIGVGGWAGNRLGGRGIRGRNF